MLFVNVRVDVILSSKTNEFVFYGMSEYGDTIENIHKLHGYKKKTNGLGTKPLQFVVNGITGSSPLLIIHITCNWSAE